MEGGDLLSFIFSLGKSGSAQMESAGEKPSAVTLGVISEAAGSFLHICPGRPGSAGGSMGAS